MDSISAGPKFKIQQSIPSGSIKKGPHAIVRSADLNDGIEILRRFGEGSKPLFARDDITVNQTSAEGSHEHVSALERNDGCKSKHNRRSTSTEESSLERYRQRDTNKRSSPPFLRRKSQEKSNRDEKTDQSLIKHIHNTKYSYTKADRYSRREKSRSRTPSPVKKKKPTEKLPYYRDEQRERDRIRRLYGHSRSRTPPALGRIAKRRFESPSRRRRSSSRDRHRRHSLYRSSNREYRRRRSRTRSKSRSPQRRERGRNIYSSRERDKEYKDDSNSLATTVITQTPQFIPIPVAVPADYAYSFPSWTAPQPSWHHRPTTAPHYGPFPMLPMMPAMRPHQAPYGSLPPLPPYAPMPPAYRPHTPQRYSNPRYSTHNYHLRPKKPPT